MATIHRVPYDPGASEISIGSCHGAVNTEKVNAQNPNPNSSPVSAASTQVSEFFPEDDRSADPSECSEVEDKASLDLKGYEQQPVAMQPHDARKQLLHDMFAEAKIWCHNVDTHAKDCEDLFDRTLEGVKTIYLDKYGSTIEMEQEFSDYVQQEYLAWLREATDCDLPKRMQPKHGLGLAARSRQDMLEELLEEVRHLHLQSRFSSKYAREERLREMLRDVIDMYLDMYGRTDASLIEVSDHIAYLWDACRWPRALRAFRAGPSRHGGQ